MDHNTTLKAIHWARMVAKEDAQTITILIINHTNWTSQKLPLNTNGDIHTIVNIPPHTIHYDPTTEWPKPSHTSIICIHNQIIPTKNLQTPQELQRVLKRITNTHTKIYPNKPTLTQYNVKFSKEWQYAPKIRIPPPPNNSITTPLSLTYNHIHPLKYIPQNCIYLDK